VSLSTLSNSKRISSVLLFIVTAAVLLLATLYSEIPPTTELDASWELAINYAWTHGFVFGRDIVWTCGPWGWLATLYYFPATFLDRFAWEIIFKILVCVLVVRLSFALSWPRRLLLIAAGALILPLFPDTAPMLLIAGLTLWVARCSRSYSPPVIAIGALFALLSLQKFTYFVTVVSSIVILALYLFPRGAHRTWTSFAGAWAVGFLCCWFLAGQTLAALPLFITRSAALASGYSEAMYLNETPLVLRLGLANALIYLLLVWSTPRADRLPLGALLTAYGFFAWKHAFVRADGHTFGFFSCMLFAGLAMPLITDPPPMWRRLGSWLLSGLAVFGCIASNPFVMERLIPLFENHLVENTRSLVDFKARRADLDREFEQARAAAALPAVRARVGPDTIDQFGFQQGFLLLNALNYRPRPIIQSYQAYSGILAALNANYYRSAAGPTFTLARLQSIDGRFPALDDAQLLPRLITDHEWVLSENGFLLLKRRPAAARLEPRLLTSGKLRYTTETCTLPFSDQTAIWARIDTPYSWLGWLRTIFYKPPEITLVVNATAAREQRFRLIAPAARAGFLLSPLLLDTADLERLVRRDVGEATQGFRLEITSSDEIFFLKRARYEIFALPDLKFKTETAPSITSLR